MQKNIYLSISSLLLISMLGLAIHPFYFTGFLQKTNTVQWKTISIDMGKLPQGKPATAIFYFTNTGKTPIVLKTVQPVCHCTTADYTKEPVFPGKSGYVKAIFDADGIGRFSKSINVKADNNESVTLTLYGVVIYSSR